MKILRIRTYNAVADFVQKVVQVLALILAGIWVIFSFFSYQAKSAKLDELIKEAQINVQKQELEYVSRHKASADCHVSVDLLRKLDAKRNRYLVTIDYEITNDTEREIDFSYVAVEIYLGEDVSDKQTGFVQEPNSEVRDGAVKWNPYYAYYEAKTGFEKEAKKALGDRFHTWVQSEVTYRIIPSKQHDDTVDQFIVDAKPGDFLGVFAHCLLDGTDPGRKDSMNDFHVKNVGIEATRPKAPKKP